MYTIHSLPHLTHNSYTHSYIQQPPRDAPDAREDLRVEVDFVVRGVARVLLRLHALVLALALALPPLALAFALSRRLLWRGRFRCWCSALRRCGGSALRGLGRGRLGSGTTHGCGGLGGSGAAGGRAALDGPPVGHAERDVRGRVVVHVDEGGVCGLGAEFLETTGIRRAGLPGDLVLRAALERRDPVRGALLERGAAADADVGAVVVRGQRLRGDPQRVEPADGAEGEDVVAVLDPGGDGDVLADADVRVARVELALLAAAAVALPVDDVLVLEEAGVVDPPGDAERQRELDEAAVVVVPEPLGRERLPAGERGLVGDVRALVLARVLGVGVELVVALVARLGEEHVRVRRDGGEEPAEEREAQEGRGSGHRGSGKSRKAENKDRGGRKSRD
ncbi:hypothetical protein B0H15DRAFT_859988 [Mycena belliarum]|uniref:Uncharacterized protein n=1 Tax=Mycena belliarum TaxID=1033014 RepID=A0AAD6XL46_9AGAR|nr:hypothetical protein B0H15DRAFT_859988 [Mycena belliae]